MVLAAFRSRVVQGRSKRHLIFASRVQLCLRVHVNVLSGNSHAPVMCALGIVDCFLQTFGKSAVVLYLAFHSFFARLDC